LSETDFVLKVGNHELDQLLGILHEVSFIFLQLALSDDKASKQIVE